MSEENKIVSNDGVVEVGGNPPPASPATAATTGVDLELQEKLAQYGATPEVAQKFVEWGAEAVSDLAFMKFEDMINLGLKPLKARKLMAELHPETPTVTPGGVAGANKVSQTFDDVLQKVPGDVAWLERLKTDGVLKVDDSSYIAAIRAALADQIGLYDVPSALIKAMDEYADTTDEQVGAEYFELRDMLTRRSYADLFSQIKGLSGSYITDGRRKKFLAAIKAELWPALIEGQNALDAWRQVYKEDMSDFGNIVSALRGQGDMASVPDTSPLHEMGDAIITSINRSFRGTGVQIAAALAYDACEILKALDNPRLPTLIGVTNRELMLKKIGVTVSSSYARQENALTQYVLSFVKHNGVTADVEARYFKTLWQLGTQINWTQLGGESNVGSKRDGVRGMTGHRIL